MTKLHCLQCGSSRLRRSRRRSKLEFAAGVFGVRFDRCHDCNARFLQLGRSLVRAGPLRKAVKKVGFMAALVAATGLVLGIILWWGHSQASPPSVEGQFVAPFARSVTTFG